MKSTEEHSNSDQTPSNRNLSQPIANKHNTKSNSLQQPPSQKDRRIDAKMEDTNKLYIR